MKSKIFFKFLFVVLSFIFIVFSTCIFIEVIVHWVKTFNKINLDTYPFSKKELYLSCFESISEHFLIFFVSILFFLIVNFNCFKFLNISIWSIIIKQAKKTKLEKQEDKAEKKQAKLAREIAQKQAELDELTNNQKKE